MPRRMTTGRGVMAVWNDLICNDLGPGQETEFETWYLRQHVPERLAIAGFRQARRYAAPDGAPGYAAFYWLDSVAVLASPAYRERLANPTAWTQRMMPRFRNMGRTPCSIAVDRGAGMGGFATWIAGMRSGAAPTLAPHAALTAGFDRCLRDPACVRIQLWECDADAARQANPEARYRRSEDTVADWIVFIEAASTDTLTAHRETLAKLLREESAALVMRAPVHRLLWCMNATEAPPPCAVPQWDEAPGA